MENASKALIIAGAILIAILLISVGIMVMNSMNRPIDQAATEADLQAVQMFNSQFTSYIGKNKSASEVRSLLSKAAAAAKNEVIVVKVDSSTHDSVTGALNNISDSNSYTVTMGTKNDVPTTGADAFSTKGQTEVAKAKEGYICWINIQP